MFYSVNPSKQAFQKNRVQKKFNCAKLIKFVTYDNNQNLKDMSTFPNIKNTLRFVAGIFAAVLFTACGSYQNGTYDHDGIYSSTQPRYENGESYAQNDPSPQTQNNDAGYYSNYFGQQAQQMENARQAIFTDVDTYSSNSAPNDTIPQAEKYYDNYDYNNEVTYDSNPSWGSNPTEIEINYINTGFYSPYYSPFYHRPLYYGASWSIGIGWGWGYYNWYYPSYYSYYPYYYWGGYYPHYYYPYYGYAYNYPYYYGRYNDRVAYHRGYRNYGRYRSADYDRNAARNRTDYTRTRNYNRSNDYSRSRDNVNTRSRSTYNRNNVNVRNPRNVNARETRNYRENSRVRTQSPNVRTNRSNTQHNPSPNTRVRSNTNTRTSPKVRTNRSTNRSSGTNVRSSRSSTYSNPAPVRSSGRSGGGSVRGRR